MVPNLVTFPARLSLGIECLSLLEATLEVGTEAHAIVLAAPFDMRLFYRYQMARRAKKSSGRKTGRKAARTAQDDRDPIAVALGKRRWLKKSRAEIRAHIAMMNEARCRRALEPEAASG